MAYRATLTHDTLVALGPEKLSKLVLHEVVRNAAFRRIVTAAKAFVKVAGLVLSGLIAG